MKKKVLSVLLTSAMVASLTACGSSKSNTPAGSDEQEAATKTESGKGNTITVGDSTETSGDITPYWTNNASDYNAYKLVNGMETVSVTKDGSFQYNDTVLESHEEKENEDGSKTWTYKIKDGLKFSNGEPVTAEDYVFAMLFWSSDEVIVGQQASEAIIVGQYIKGFKAFSTGESDTLEGVHLIDDKTFSVTIDAQYLPYYYGKALASVGPDYMKGWVPEDVTIEETENGAKFSDTYTAEHIADTVKEYRYNPTACSGPYKFVSYDDKAYCYTLEKNENFPGNYEGQKAQIDTIIYQYTKEDTMMDQLKTGAVDLLLQATTGDEIDQGLDMVDAGGFDYCNYPRSGYGKLVFKCNVGPTQFLEVRQAIAYLLDRNAFAKTFTGGHGIVVNGPYGSSQWMVKEAEDEVDALNTYSYSVDSAIKVLEEGGWVYNEDGSDYSGSGIRYKKLEDGTMMPLVIEWFSSENNTVSDLLVTSLQQKDEVAQAGMKINQTVGTFNELIEIYYNSDPTAYNYNMLNMGEGFGNPYDVAMNYEPNGASNHNCIDDKELYDDAVAMNQTEEDDSDAYLANWVKFQQRWNELLPDLPLYSNDYHDFYNTRVSGFQQDGYAWDFSKAILYTTVE